MNSSASAINSQGLNFYPPESIQGDNISSETPNGILPESGFIGEASRKKARRMDQYSITTSPIASSDERVRVVSFEEVLQNFEKEHGKYGDTNYIARHYIKQAHTEIVEPNNGGWLLVKLPFETAMKVLLPGHTHDGERKTLLEGTGLTAKRAADNYKNWTEQDKKDNPLCSGSLSYHLENPGEKPIFLTVEPINVERDYGEIRKYPELAEGRLIHLDGLHRLVALAINNKPESMISAYIACKDTPKHIHGLGLISRDGLADSSSLGRSISAPSLEERLSCTPRNTFEISPRQSYQHIVATLAAKQLPNENIDQFSIDNMALALEFAGVKNLKEAEEMELKIIPPGPVLYTWAPLHGTGIFDGENNPVKYKKFNYVQKIKDSAAFLAQHNVPVLVIWSKKEMPEGEIQKMRSYFCDDDNIISLCLEEDLINSLASSPEIFTDLRRMVYRGIDAIRIAVIRDFPEVLKVATGVAGQKSKHTAATGLTARTESICYSDIDNTWVRYPPYIISRLGLHAGPVLEINKVSESKRTQLDKDAQDILDQHYSYFSGHPYCDSSGSTPWTEEKREASFTYLISHQAHRQEMIIPCYLREISKDFKPIRFEDDNGLLNVRKDAIETFKARTELRNSSVTIFPSRDIFPPPDVNAADPYSDKSNKLVVMQFWRVLDLGHDYTWVK